MNSKADSLNLTEVLHHDIGGGLTSIRMIADTALSQQNTTNKQLLRILEQCGNLQSIINDLIENIETSNKLNGSLIDNIVSTIKQSELISSASINANLDPTLNKLNLNQSYSIYRLVQEALNNSVKHSLSQTIEIEVIIREHILIRVIDDGIGMVVSDRKKKTIGNGLRLLKQRVNANNGQLDIKSNIPTGTVVEIILPNMQMKS